MDENYKIALDHIAELMKNNGVLEREAVRWIQTIIRNEPAGKEVIIDTGYDISAHGYKTDDAINTKDFITIQDFLDLPTGESVPTYESGSGMRSESWEEELYRYISDRLWHHLKSEGLYQLISQDGVIIDDEFTYILCDSDYDIYIFIDRLGSKPFPKLAVVK